MSHGRTAVGCAAGREEGVDFGRDGAAGLHAAEVVEHVARRADALEIVVVAGLNGLLDAGLEHRGRVNTQTRAPGHRGLTNCLG